MAHPTETQAPPDTGRWITCGCCRHGLRFDGSECRYCNNGSVWRYPSGVLALWRGGPLAGRDSEPRDTLPGKPHSAILAEQRAQDARVLAENGVVCDHAKLHVIVSYGHNLDDHTTTFGFCPTCIRHLRITEWKSGREPDVEDMTHEEIDRVVREAQSEDEAKCGELEPEDEEYA